MAYRSPREQHELNITLRVRTLVTSQSLASLNCQPQLQTTCTRVPKAAIKLSNLRGKNAEPQSENHESVMFGTHDRIFSEAIAVIPTAKKRWH